MVKETITYMNPFTEEMVTEDHYFHISKADLVEMDMEEHKATYRDKEGNELTGMRAHLQRIVDSEDAKAVLKEFKAILRRAYGKKVGDRFIKNEETWAEFEGSDAYSELVFNLLTDADKIARFINKIVPGNLEEIAAEVAARADAETTAVEVTEPPKDVEANNRRNAIVLATPEAPVRLTEEESKALPFEDLKSGLGDGRYVLA